jgi:hypothetical protein
MKAAFARGVRSVVVDADYQYPYYQPALPLNRTTNTLTPKVVEPVWEKILIREK